jgi:Skp family chaperone for outer membrane proteins
VWTNDEIEGAKSDTSITNKNVAGAGGASSSSPSAAAKSATYENLVKTYQKKLAPLRDQLAEIDRKVQQVKDLKGNARENTEQLLSYYGEKRAGVQLKIDRVEEDARRDGVAPGDLR